MRLFRTVASSIGGTWGTEPDGGPDDTPVVRVADFDYSNLTVRSDIPTLRSTTPAERAGRALAPGDILVEKSGGGLRTNVGRAVVWRGENRAVCSNFIQMLRPFRAYDSSYLAYLHRALYVQGVAAASTKQTTGIQNLDVAAYLATEVEVPVLHRQEAVVDFLDCESERITLASASAASLVAAARAMERANLETELDTHGKEHGRHRLGWFVRVLPGFTFSSDGFIDYPAETAVRLLRGVNVSVGTIRWADVIGWPADHLPHLDAYRLSAGDLVLGMDRPWIAGGLRIASISESDLPAFLVQRVAALKPRDRRVDSRYVRLWLERDLFRHDLGHSMTGVSVPHISGGQIEAYRIAVPHREVQEACVVAHDDHSMAIDALERVAAALRSRLAEYRDALITEAVTGQLNVGAVSDAQMDERMHEAVEVLRA